MSIQERIAKQEEIIISSNASVEKYQKERNAALSLAKSHVDNDDIKNVTYYMKLAAKAKNIIEQFQGLIEEAKQNISSLKEEIKESENSVFVVGQKYGNDLVFEVVKRTAKTIVIKTQAWGETRVKIRSFINAGGSITESISFKAWYILATETYDKEKASEISHYKAYYL